MIKNFKRYNQTRKIKRVRKMKRVSIINFNLENKTVFLRVDYNVPLNKNKVIDNSKIKASLPTIKFLLEKNCKIVLATHLGKPKGKVVSALRVNPIAKELKKLLPKEVKIIKLNDCIGKEIKTKIKAGKAKDIFFLENLRFHKEEKENNPAFAKSLASLAGLYVNDAFAVCHRKHASLEAITHFLPAVAGFLIEKEVHNLNKTLKPKKPVVWILGGAKLRKINLIKRLLKKADYILIGGALSFCFLKAKGIPVGMSKIDSQSVMSAKQILKKRIAKRKLILPLDFIVAEKISPKARTNVTAYNQIKINQMGLDLGPKTIKLFEHYLKKASTIIWNGPLGCFELAKFANATREVGKFIGKLDAISICGGGETVEAIKKLRLEHHFTHVSTGGGASLRFLSGERLPSLIALEKNHEKFGKGRRLSSFCSQIICYTSV